MNRRNDTVHSRVRETDVSGNPSLVLVCKKIKDKFLEPAGGFKAILAGNYIEGLFYACGTASLYALAIVGATNLRILRPTAVVIIFIFDMLYNPAPPELIAYALDFEIVTVGIGDIYRILFLELICLISSYNICENQMIVCLCDKFYETPPYVTGTKLNCFLHVLSYLLPLFYITPSNNNDCHKQAIQL